MEILALRCEQIYSLIRSAGDPLVVGSPLRRILAAIRQQSDRRFISPNLDLQQSAVAREEENPVAVGRPNRTHFEAARIGQTNRRTSADRRDVDGAELLGAHAGVRNARTIRRKRERQEGAILIL